jgi:4-amino-4-deoxy-L-arabinose transferase-like glycosyltransferase
MMRRMVRLGTRFVPFGLLLFGLWLRVIPLMQNRFHPDEALYATFARLIASGHDPLLSSIVVDKPPLPFYLMAASMGLFGDTEFAARLPTLFASILTIALTYKLARLLYNRGAASLAALSLALSPLAILFAITLFTDTLLSMFLMASLVLAQRQRWSLAGLAFGLAFASKQAALFLLPLVVIVGVLQFTHTRENRTHKELITISARPALSAVINFMLPIALCTLLIFLWDAIRFAPISFWVQGVSDNNPGRLIRANEILPRYNAWVDLLQYIMGSQWVGLALLIGLPVVLLANQRSLSSLYDIIFTVFCLGFIAGYWLFAFNVWDRYLVILIPIVSILIGRVFANSAQNLWQFAQRIGGMSRRVAFGFTFAVLFIVNLPPATIATQSGYPIGGDHGAYDGIDEIGSALYKVEPGAVLYDHWLSWELGFYFFDGPASLAWMPSPGALATDLIARGHQTPSYIVSPSWESFTETQTAIEGAGFIPKVVTQTYRRDGTLSFTLYELVPK